MNLFPPQQQPVSLLEEQNPPQHIILYAVQRCWHSGPRQFPPVDYRRLFRSQRDAEEVAFHSAGAWATTHGGPAGPNSVKTLLLPSYPKHNQNPQGSSYGFIAYGALFWVRALQATVTTVGRYHNRAICHTEVYAVLTEGVIGGTGNLNSRRGTEVWEGRVFGGDASSRLVAMEALRRVQQASASPASALMDNDSSVSLRVHVETLPIGSRAEYTSGTFLTDWPAQVLQHPENPLLEPHHKREAAVMMTTGPDGGRWVHIRGSGSDDSHSSNSDYESGGHLYHHHHPPPPITDPHHHQYSIDDVEDEGMVVDCPFEMPVAKRRRFGDESGMDSHYGGTGTGSGTFSSSSSLTADGASHNWTNQNTGNSSNSIITASNTDENDIHDGSDSVNNHTDRTISGVVGWDSLLGGAAIAPPAAVADDVPMMM
jgi:hypothetical protein